MGRVRLEITVEVTGERREGRATLMSNRCCGLKAFRGLLDVSELEMLWCPQPNTSPTIIEKNVKTLVCSPSNLLWVRGGSSLVSRSERPGHAPLVDRTHSHSVT